MKKLKFSVDMVCAVTTLLMWLLTLMQVISRYIIKSPVGSTLEILGITFLASTFIGAFAVHIEEGHLGFDFVYSRLNTKNKERMDFIVNIVILIFLIIMVISGVIGVNNGWVSKMPLTGLPISFKYVFLPISFLLMIIYTISNIYKYIITFNVTNKK